MKSLLILGAGGFGRMVAETAQALGYEKVVFLDDAVKEIFIVRQQARCLRCRLKSMVEMLI